MPSKFKFETRPATYDDGFLSVRLSLTGAPDPFPPRVVEVKTAAEAIQAFEAYKAEAKATGAGMVATLKTIQGTRAPNGFNKATEKWPYYHRVNLGEEVRS